MHNTRSHFSHSLRRAFTLVELLVVIAIIALVVTLLMPAVNHTHSGLRVSCRNNVKQLALALQNHNDTYKTFPPLFFSGDPARKANPALSPANAAEYYAWQTRVLPFIEEDTLYKSISTSSKKFTANSTTIKVPTTKDPISPKTINMSALHCPFFTEDQPDGNNNYLALSSTRLPLLLNTVVGSDSLPAYKQEPDGMLIPGTSQRGEPISRMADGSSKTAVLIESREVLRSNWYDPQQSFVVGFLPADTAPIDAAASNYYPFYGPKQPGTVAAPAPSQWQFNLAMGNRTALAADASGNPPKVPYHAIPGDPLERTWGPSSAHMGGIIIVGMGDGSVREITDDIDPAVFFAAITARGGEAVPGLGDQN